MSFWKNLKLVILVFIAVGMIANQSLSQDATHLSLIEDGAGLFNERGFLRSNSFSLDGNEVINDYNGNLIYTQGLHYAPITQNGIHEELRIAYNGSVGHLVRGGINLDPDQNQLSINIPEWIISINNIAIQTFNFENEAISWNRNGGSVSKEDDVAALINGYHSCYTHLGNDQRGIVSILMGDGSIKQFTSLPGNPINPFSVYSGEYRSLSKDDQSRGYVEFWSGDFTLFQEDGTRVDFQYFEPEWRTIDSMDFSPFFRPKMFLPVSFKAQMGPNVTVSYQKSVICGTDTLNIYGRPLVASASIYSFDWGSFTHCWPLVNLKLDALSGKGPEYNIRVGATNGGVTTMFDERNRGHVIDITDAVGRVTKFEYRSYTRAGLGLGGHFSSNIQMGIGDDIVIFPQRMFKLTYPDGGEIFYSYYDDRATEWPNPNTAIVDSLEIDFKLICQDEVAFPCRKSSGFDGIGRDPFFTNMVCAKTRVDNGSLLSRDSLRFSWTDTSPLSYISVNDTFKTTRYKIAIDPVELDAAIQGWTEFDYCQFPEQGFFSQKSRDRGWQMKLIEQRVFAKDATEIWKREQAWNIDSFNCDPYCPGNFLLKWSIDYQDGIPTKTWFDYGFTGDETLDTVNNFEWTSITDAVSRVATSYYNTSHLTIVDTGSFYSVALVDSTKFEILPNILLSMSASEFYDGTSDSGFVGQTARSVTYEVNSGTIVDSVEEKFEYVPATALRILDHGALRKRVSPNGDSTIFHYQEYARLPKGYVGKGALDSLICPLLAIDIQRDGTADTTSRRFDSNGPFWWKVEQFKSNSLRILEDTVITGELMVVARADWPGTSETKIDTIDIDQMIDYQLRLPAIGGGDGCGDSFAWIKKNGFTVRHIVCKPFQQTIMDSVSVVSSDIIQVEVEHEGGQPGDFMASFAHEVLGLGDDTTIFFDTIPDAIVSYQHIDNEGKPLELVNPHLIKSDVWYDQRDRVKNILLPGEFVPGGFWFPTPKTLELDPYLDGEFGSEGVLADLENCDWDTIRVFDTGATYERGALFSYEYVDLSDIDSASILNATLTLHKVHGLAVFDIMSFKDDYPNCDGTSFTVDHDTTAGGNIGTIEDSVILDVTEQIRWWFSSEPLTNPAQVLGIEPGVTTENNLVFYSMEAIDPAKRPKLRITYMGSASLDSVGSVRYSYDDDPKSGDPGVSVTAFIKPDSNVFVRRTKAHFDGFGRGIKTELIDSLSNIDSTKTKYDFADRPISVKDQLGFETNSILDNRNRPLKTVFPDSAASYTTVRYGRAGTQGTGLDTIFGTFFDTNLYVTTWINENGDSTKEYVDVLGQARIHSQFLNDTAINTYYDYDDYGNAIKVIKPKGDFITYVYNSIGQLMMESSNDYGVKSYEYDKSGNLVAAVDGNIAALGINFSQYIHYDALNRVTESGLKEYFPVGDSTVYTPSNRYFYDQSLSSNSMGKLSLSLSTEEGYKYGEKYDYDFRGRLIRQVNYFNALLDSSILVGTSDWFEFKLVGDSFVISNEYNMADQLTRITYPDGMIVTYEYDQLGRLKYVGDQVDVTKYATLSYTARGEVEQVMLGNSLQIIDYVYNARGWLNTINNGSSDTTFRRFAERLYYYDNPDSPGWPAQKNGNVIVQKLSVEGQAIDDVLGYKYDDLNRLTSTHAGLLGAFFDREVFTYDNNGNRMSYNIDGTVPIISNYSTISNQLLSREQFGIRKNKYTYDPAGNLAWDSTKNATFDYDIYNRLDTVTFADPSYIDDYLAFGYSASGDRIYKRYHTFWQEPCDTAGHGGGIEFLSGGGSLQSSDPSGIGGGGTQSVAGPGGGAQCPKSAVSATYYVRGNGKVLAEYGSTSSSVSTYNYIYAGSNRIAMRKGSTKTLHFYLNDHLGTPRVVIDSAGNVKDKMEFYAFGEMDSETSSTGQDYKYTGKPKDDDGGLDLYYSGSRYYDSETGRFAAVDPAQSIYPSFSPYLYVANNPLAFVDPDGLWIIRVVDDGNGSLMVIFEAEPGDDLNTLSEQTGIPVEELEQLLDPQTLQAVREGRMISFTDLGEYSDRINEALNRQLSLGRELCNCWATAISYGRGNRVLKFRYGSDLFTLYNSPTSADSILQVDFEPTTTPRLGDVIRYSDRLDGGTPGATTHYATFLLRNSHGTQVFTKNGMNAGPWEVMYQSELPNIYGNPKGLLNSSPYSTKR